MSKVTHYNKRRLQSLEIGRLKFVIFDLYLDRWWYENDEIVLTLWLFGRTMYLKRKKKYSDHNRRFGLSIYTHRAQISLGKQHHILNGSSWPYIYYNRIGDWLFGKPTMTKKKHDEVLHSHLHLPDYENPTITERFDFTLSKYSYVSKRPRRPFSKKWMRSEMELDRFVQHPGKGTCSYNIADDWFSWISTCEDISIHQAKAMIAEKCYKYRSLYPL